MSEFTPCFFDKYPDHNNNNNNNDNDNNNNDDDSRDDGGGDNNDDTDNDYNGDQGDDDNDDNDEVPLKRLSPPRGLPSKLTDCDLLKNDVVKTPRPMKMSMMMMMIVANDCIDTYNKESCSEWFFKYQCCYSFYN